MIQFNEKLFNLKAQTSLLFHYLFDGSYGSHAYNKNRVLIFSDNYSDTLTGNVEETAELGLSGERLAMKFQPMAATQALAASIAAAEMARARIASKDGFITLPPHCGVELYDVITIQDELCSQGGSMFRVVGIKLVYDQASSQYYQQLLLGAV
jgi:hypothetical protein